jgi:hypothetical protein
MKTNNTFSIQFYIDERIISQSGIPLEECENKFIDECVLDLINKYDIKNIIDLEKKEIDYGVFMYTANFSILSNKQIQDIFREIPRDSAQETKIKNIIFGELEPQYNLSFDEMKMFALEYDKQKLESELKEIEIKLNNLKNK